MGGWVAQFSQIGLPWSEARVYTNYFGKLSHRVNQGGGKNTKQYNTNLEYSGDHHTTALDRDFFLVKTVLSDFCR